MERAAGGTALHADRASDEAATVLVAVRTGRHAALYGLGRLEEADEEYRRIDGLSATILDRADATAVQVLSLTHRTRFADAIGLGIGSLRELGITVPPADRLPAELDRQFGYLYRSLDDTDEAADLARPGITDPALIAIARVINALLPVTYVADHATLAWLSLEALRIWLEHGPGAALVGPVSHTAFVAVTLRGDYAVANRAMRRILALVRPAGMSPAPHRRASCMPPWPAGPGRWKPGSRKPCGPGRGCSQGVTWPTPPTPTNSRCTTSWTRHHRWASASPRRRRGWPSRAAPATKKPAGGSTAAGG